MGQVRYCAGCFAIYRQDFPRCPLDGSPLVLGIDPWLGLTVGKHYVIEALIGEGAMARVYRVHHRAAPQRRYALKILIGDYAARAQMRTRFVFEASNASRLSHPNIVGVVDYDVTDRGINFIVMDLVDGPTLGAIVRQGPMDPDRVIRLTRQICEGLEHAHERGMIHRDLKPENILLVNAGESEVARIADFGLALSTHHETRLTTTGVVCTPAYAAPEQLRGMAIDHRIDLYALGTTMFEMLSGGVLPFEGDLKRSIDTKIVSEAPSILVAAPHVPPALVSIIGRLLSSDPKRRPRSARVLIRALDQAMAAPCVAVTGEQTVRLRPTTKGEPTPAQPRSLPGSPALPATRTMARRLVEQLARPKRMRNAFVQLCAGALVGAGLVAWIDLQLEATVYAEPRAKASAVAASVSAAAVSPIEWAPTPDSVARTLADKVAAIDDAGAQAAMSEIAVPAELVLVDAPPPLQSRPEVDQPSAACSAPAEASPAVCTAEDATRDP